jgi:hypothetical protein
MGVISAASLLEYATTENLFETSGHVHNRRTWFRWGDGYNRDVRNVKIPFRKGASDFAQMNAWPFINVSKSVLGYAMSISV